MVDLVGSRGATWRGTERGEGAWKLREKRQRTTEAGRSDGGRRKGGGRVRVRHVGGQGAFFVLLFPVCLLLGPLCRSWTPTPTLAEAGREEQGCHYS